MLVDWNPRLFSSLVAWFGLATVASRVLFVDFALCETARKRDSVKIDGGFFAPQYGVSKIGAEVEVDSFRIDRYPVTNQDFMRFIERVPNWEPHSVSSLFADRPYLSHLHITTKVGGDAVVDHPRAPVVNVSWFAASAFCKYAGGRLPTVYEWEYVAAADEKLRDATKDPQFVQRLLEWYSSPGSVSQTRDVGTGQSNVWGVYDLHGVVWEWTEDFNSVFIAPDNRRDGEESKNLFCGSGSLSAADRANYAAFMRYAFRSSLEGRYCSENLGFRCAYSIANERKRSNR